MLLRFNMLAALAAVAVSLTACAQQDMGTTGGEGAGTESSTADGQSDAGAASSPDAAEDRAADRGAIDEQEAAEKPTRAIGSKKKSKD